MIVPHLSLSQRVENRCLDFKILVSNLLNKITSLFCCVKGECISIKNLRDHKWTVGTDSEGSAPTVLRVKNLASARVGVQNSTTADSQKPEPQEEGSCESSYTSDDSKNPEKRPRNFQEYPEKQRSPRHWNVPRDSDEVIGKFDAKYFQPLEEKIQAFEQGIQYDIKNELKPPALLVSCLEKFKIAVEKIRVSAASGRVTRGVYMELNRAEESLDDSVFLLHLRNLKATSDKFWSDIDKVLNKKEGSNV